MAFNFKMTQVKANELEFRSLVISWLNEFMSTASYSFEIASGDPSIKVSEKKTRFPDVQIWINREAGDGFCGWELKTPETAADDPDLLRGAVEKAQAIRADYFVTWNMCDAVIWRTPRSRLEPITHEYRLKTYDPLYQITKADDLKVVSNREALKARARQILSDLAMLHRDGHLHLVDIDATFFVHILSEGVKRLWPYVHKALINRVGSDSDFKKGLFDWATKQGIANYEDESFYETVSRQIVYRLLGRILFYLTLRRFRVDIEKMNLTVPPRVSQELKRYFAIARDIDYQAVFEEDFTDQVELPPEAAGVLIELVDDLNRFDFGRMPQDVIGQVFEQLIPYEERHALGQYFTKEDLVDFINAFCVRSSDAKVLDPTCGTGTFLIRAYARLKFLGERDHRKLLSKLWGIDIAHFPAELATINLYRQNLDDYANFPRIVAEDFFNVKPKQTFKFPPPKPTANFMIEEPLPTFDTAVGNFPYIRQELIEKRIKGYKRNLTKVIAQEWVFEYPDIYTYLFFHTTCFLREGGRLGFLTSNAWMDVAYGYELQKFLLNNFKIIAIVESRCEPWFEDSAVNTVFTILERCSDPKKREDHIVKFVKIKRRLKDLIPWDLKLDAHRRHQGLDALTYRIERVGKEHIKIQGTKVVNTLKGLKTYEDEDFRIRYRRQGELLKELKREGKTVKWGRYLRAPDVYFEILEKAKDKLVPLKEVAEVRFGIKTGINEFFYLTEEKIRHWGTR